MEFPERSKYEKIRNKSYDISNFLIWFRDKYDMVFPESIPNILANYFDIDTEKLIKENKAFSDAIKSGQIRVSFSKEE